MRIKKLKNKKCNRRNKHSLGIKKSQNSISNKALNIFDKLFQKFNLKYSISLDQIKIILLVLKIILELSN
ncbi:hypothetical protein SAMN05444146_2337 [Flavobacterium johnsoniae]|nr:hypothetical protein B0A63_11065 [Flavobacterium johnsoniae UW101]SHK80830.1 hypothetical protein SAMN05444146_2337 [Flavobacterium johnsoniae]